MIILIFFVFINVKLLKYTQDQKIIEEQRSVKIASQENNKIKKEKKRLES